MSDTFAFTLLQTIVGNMHRAQRHAVMKACGPKKYAHVKRYKDENDRDGEHLPISDAELHAHLLGQATYAVPLIGTDALAGAGLIEQDAGGLDMARRILDAAEARGVVMFAIVMKGSGGHDGCHAWALYDGRHDPAIIRAQLRLVAEDAGASTDEIHPNNTNIRLPFGLHLRSKSRGRLLLQSGELFDLDDALDLEAAECAVLKLRLNSAPPAVQPIPKAQQAVTQPLATQTRHSSGRASLDDVRKRFNAEHTWEELIGARGGAITRDGWACNCGFNHSHTTQGAITSQEKIVAFSPNCAWAPLTTSGMALDKFGFYVAQWHGGDITAALKTLNPIESRSTKRSAPPVYPGEPRVQTPEQAADAARKRKAHQRQAAEVIADVQARASHDERLTNADRAVLEAMITVADGRDWCRPSKARLVELTGYSLGSVKRSLMRLEGFNYIDSDGKGGTSNQTAIRRFLRGSSSSDPARTIVRGSSGAKADSASFPDASSASSERTIVRGSSGAIIESDMIHESYSSWNLNPESSRACEAAPQPPAVSEADTLDTWQAVCDEHGADELAFLDEPTHKPEPEAAAVVLNVRALPEGARIVRPKHGPYCWACLGALTGPSRPRATPDALLIADAWGLWEAMQPAVPVPDAPAENRSRPDLASAGLGASYTAPIAEPSGDYTGRPKHDVPDRIRWALASETIRVVDVPVEVCEVEKMQMETPPMIDTARHLPREVSALDRYRVAITTMSESQLAGEIRKHTATLKKYKVAVWLDQVRDKLAIVQGEIDERAAVDEFARPHKLADRRSAQRQHLNHTNGSGKPRRPYQGTNSVAEHWIFLNRVSSDCFQIEQSDSKPHCDGLSQTTRALMQLGKTLRSNHGWNWIKPLARASGTPSC